MRNFRPSDPRIWLPFLHAAIALALVLNLYLPHWGKERSRDIASQAYVDQEARAGRWPPVSGVIWEGDYFGPPRHPAFGRLKVRSMKQLRRPHAERNLS
jgi:hypothetical protein